MTLSVRFANMEWRILSRYREKEESMLKAYLYCCKKFMNSESYAKLLEKNEVYHQVNEELSNEIEELKKHSRPTLNEETLSEWKEQYRRLGTGEI